MPSKRHAWRDIKMAVHPHTTRVQPPRHAFRFFNIIGPNTSSKPPFPFVGARNDVVFVFPFKARKDRAKGFIGDDGGIIGGIIDDGWFKKVAFSLGIGIWDIAAKGRGPFFGGNMLVHGSHLIELHFILNGADEDVGVGAGADFEGCGVGGEGGEEAGVDVFMDVEAFDHHADLGAAEEGEGGEL